MKKILRILLIVLILFPTIFVFPASAADFDVLVDYVFTVDTAEVMHITETRTIKNHTSRYYIQGTTEETFYISTFKTRAETTKEDLEKVAETIVMKDENGKALNPTITVLEEDIELKVSLGSDLLQNQQKQFVLEYDNFELVEKAGNIWDIYLPLIPGDHGTTQTDDSGASTYVAYSVTLKVDNSLGDPNFVLPEPSQFSQTNGTSIYTFDANDLVDQAVWIQFGNKQYYQFTLRQQLNLEDSLESSVFNAWYDLVLPRSNENQEVYYSAITPEPDYIIEEAEGNIIARFSFSDNDISEIVAEGYIVTSISEEITQDEVGSVGEIDLSKVYAEFEDQSVLYKDLLSAQEYWEVTAPAIQEKAEDLKGDYENVYDILLADYHFVIDNVDYDDLKIGITNVRKGALSTLQGGSSVCMEYSDLLITLLRAQGIPSRAAYGYGFDPRSETEDDEGHQWVEVYMPNIGWVAVDPTWGDTARKNYIGGDVDHALWYVAGINVNEPSPVVEYSLVGEGYLDSPIFEIQVVEALDTESLTTLEELLIKYKETPRHQLVERIEQLNIYGKVLFLGIPAFLFLVIIIIVIFAVIRMIKKKRGNNYVHAEPAGHDVPNNPYY